MIVEIWEDWLDVRPAGFFIELLRSDLFGDE